MTPFYFKLAETVVEEDFKRFEQNVELVHICLFIVKSTGQLEN